MIWPPATDLDPKPAAAHLVDHPVQPLGCPVVHVERGGECGRHPPLDLRLRNDVGGVDDGCGARSRQRAARLHDESASLHGAGLLHAADVPGPVATQCLIIPRRADGRRLRRRGPTGPTSAWNFVNDACTFRAMGVFSDSSLMTSAASFFRSRSTGTGSWQHLDLALELRLEALERDRVLRVEGRETIDLHRCGGVVQRPPEIHRKRVVRFLVEAELVRGTWLVPAWVVVVACGLVEA